MWDKWVELEAGRSRSGASMEKIRAFAWYSCIYLAVQQLDRVTADNSIRPFLRDNENLCYFAREKPSWESKLYQTSLLQAPPSKIKIIKILSIDGGGVRGILAARILSTLEEKLQALHGSEDARIADHVDIIAGTSTGGLIAAMLASPDKTGRRPMFQAKDIVKFYKENSSQIFRRSNKFMTVCRKVRACFCYPKYSGKKLRHIISEMIPNLRLNETLTNLVIPTFDMKKNEAIVFTTYKAQTDMGKNPYLKDVCIGTSAAPTYLPPYEFYINDTSEQCTRLHLIDGAIVANDPTFLAMSEAIMEYKKHYLWDLDYKNLQFVVLSIGSGEGLSKQYDAKAVGKWGMLRWAEPLIDAVFQGNAESQKILTNNFIWDKVAHYLRIQPKILHEELGSLDNSSKKNLERLVRIAEEHLEKTLSENDFQGANLKDVQNLTYQKALEIIAEKLFQGKKK